MNKINITQVQHDLLLINKSKSYNSSFFIITQHKYYNGTRGSHEDHD